MDISNHVHDYARLRNRSKLMDLAQDVLIVLDAAGVILDVNEAAAKLHGTSVEELIGTSVLDLVHPDSMYELTSVSRDLLLAGTDGYDTMILKAVVKNGDIVHLELRVSFSHDDQQFYVVERDVTDTYQRTTELQALSEKLRVLAATDTLTGIANRASFDQRLEEARLLDEDAWLVIADVDMFKAINDTHGHLAGDHVLKLIAKRASAQLNSNELFARIGGDEFAFVLPVTLEVDADERLMQLEQAITGEFEVDGGLIIQLTCSIGACRRVLGETTEDWLRRTDAAMYVHKQSRVCPTSIVA